MIFKKGNQYNLEPKMLVIISKYYSMSYNFTCIFFSTEFYRVIEMGSKDFPDLFALFFFPLSASFCLYLSIFLHDDKYLQFEVYTVTFQSVKNIISTQFCFT